ncbi:MAG: transcription-repair coupling factor, partial [Clostridia bacterium]|nr:transcription-repair coupling factor [Clostridia bacterium]
AQIVSLLEEGLISSKNAEFSGNAAQFEKFIFSDCSVLLTGMGSRLSGHKYAGLFSFATKQTTGYGERFDLLCEDLRGYMSGGYRVKLICETETSADHLEKMLVNSGFGAYKDTDQRVQREASVALVWGQSIPGFELTHSKYVCLTELQTDAVRKRSSRVSSKRKKDKNLQRILSYADMSVGDYVVHDIHGIGQYMGMSSLTVEGVRKDFLKIKYAGKDMLYLPCGQLDKISKYIGKGAEEGELKLSKMGGADWKKVKIKAKLSAQNMAKQLIGLYAARMKKDGISFPKDDEMQREFESAFEYEETDCQLSAVEDVKRDMEGRVPMDRLLCGDVGYGKTEVAMRAAFKAVSGGYQVAILVPTTILCMQHYRTLLSRMRGFPVSVDMVCRFRSAKEIEESLRKLRRGETDIIVGTHRLLSKDVEFKKLGLLIIDEEQRFGVTHKEKLKELSKNVDVLTLSATPIPRTMNMALSGIRDMSVLDEAPVDRLPVQTFVLEHDDGVIFEAIRREFRRGGQVFYLCNSIEVMPDRAGKLQREFPDMRVEIANGQMDKDRLSDIWEEMIRGEIDILVSTTIIETGVDVPNANTLIIERADKLGLSQLHQIRGRVGRSSRRAYAYFTYPAGRELREISEKRLSAIRDFTEFGAGFRIAMRDMEIRGVGNLLGAEQHGHMESIGYDLYMKLLSEAVSEEKGEKIEKRTECSVDLPVDAYVPEEYIPNANQRIDAYKKISLIENAEDLSDVYDELLDRYGEVPQTVLNILTISYVRALGSKAGISKIVSKSSGILFYPEKPSAFKMTKLACEYNGKVMVTLSGEQYFSLRTPSSASYKSVKMCVELLEKYTAIEEQPGGDPARSN